MTNEINTSGPEYAPLKDYIKDFPIILTIFDKDDNVIREENLNYGNYKHKRHLGKLSFWAWSNGYIVETKVANDK